MSKATSAANAGWPETTAKSEKCVRDDRIFRLPRHPTLSGTRELLFGRLPALLAAAMRSDAYAARFSGIDPSTVTHTRRARAATDPAQIGSPRNAACPPPFRRIVASEARLFRRLFASPGPIFEAQGSSVDPWGVARPMHAMGFRAGEIVLNTFSYHLVPAGFMMDSGARELGCAVIPAGPGNTEQQFEFIDAFRPTSIAARPTSSRSFSKPRPMPGATSFSSSARWSRAPPFRKHFRTRSQRQDRGFPSLCDG